MEKNKKRSQFQKKGDITIAQIVTFILLVLGFIIILVFYYNIDWKGNLGTETCKESVLFRATAGQISGQAQQFIPLKCRTEKFCLTTKLFGSGNCKEEFGTSTRITTVRVSSLTQAEKFYADEVFRCWQMMGEGKVSLFYDSTQTFGFGKVYPSCVICSRIAFDNVDFNLKLEDMNVHRYMSTHKVPGRDYTYAQYLTGNTDIKDIATNVNGQNTNALMDFADKIADLKTSDNENGSNSLVDKSSLTFEKLLPDSSSLKKENAVVFMQIVSPNYGPALTNSLKTLGITMGVSYMLAPSTATVTRAVILSPLTWIALAIAGIGQQASVAYNRAVTAGYCSDVLSGSGAKKGCSVVRTVNYNVQDISNYCQNIESIP